MKSLNELVMQTIQESKLGYNDIDVKYLLKVLTDLDKKGITSIQLNGTLLVKDDGNFIISSTTRQG